MNEDHLSSLERTFLFYWSVLAPDAPEPVNEYRFAPPRRWRFDFAWPDARVAVECQGGTWTRGRHSRGRGQRGDAEKNNTAVYLGWRVFYVTADMLEDMQGMASLLLWIAELVNERIQE